MISNSGQGDSLIKVNVGSLSSEISSERRIEEQPYSQLFEQQE